MGRRHRISDDKHHTSNPGSTDDHEPGANGEITNAGLMDITGTVTLNSDSLFKAVGR